MKYFFLISLMLLASCTTQNNESDTPSALSESGRIRVETSIVPLASLVNQIGGTEVIVNTIVPAGVSPHNFDMRPSQIQDISDADLIVMVGLDHIDGFLDTVVGGKNILRTAEDIPLLEVGQDEDGHTSSELETLAIDPHVWISAENAIIIARDITTALTALRPEKEAFFEQNFTDFQSELTLIRGEFLLSQSAKSVDSFLIFHDAYTYLFEELGIPTEQKIVFQKTVLSDPNSADMRDLIDAIEARHLTIAFREPQLVSTNLEQIAREYGMTVLLLDPIGMDTGSGGYILNYQKNLDALSHVYH